MHTYLECLPCFLKQAIEACKIINLSEEKTKSIVDKVSLEIPSIKLTDSPPLIAKKIYKILGEEAGTSDPYKEIKRKSNELAMSIYPELKKIVNNSSNKILKAVEVAIAGNIIDYGALSNLQIDEEINKILSNEEKQINNENTKYFNFDGFIESLSKAGSLLYLLDNTGEIIFDRVLIEEIQKNYPHIIITTAVRGKPVINDCTLEDAEYAGIDKITNVISNGDGTPGTILKDCSAEFIETWNKSPLVISKGQGNFESLSGTCDKEIFFMFIAKCPVITDHLGCKFKDVILCKNDF